MAIRRSKDPSYLPIVRCAVCVLITSCFPFLMLACILGFVPPREVAILSALLSSRGLTVLTNSRLNGNSNRNGNISTRISSLYRDWSYRKPVNASERPV